MQFLTRVTLTTLIATALVGKVSWPEGEWPRFNLCGIPALWRQAGVERERKQDLLAQEETIHARTERKTAICAELVAGRLTLPQAAGAFRTVCADVPLFEDNLRGMFPQVSEPERYCLYVIGWAQDVLLVTEPDKAVATAGRLRAQLDELRRSDSPLTLP